MRDDEMTGNKRERGRERERGEHTKPRGRIAVCLHPQWQIVKGARIGHVAGPAGHVGDLVGQGEPGTVLLVGRGMGRWFDCMTLNDQRIQINHLLVVVQELKHHFARHARRQRRDACEDGSGHDGQIIQIRGCEYEGDRIGDMALRQRRERCTTQHKLVRALGQETREPASGKMPKAYGLHVLRIGGAVIRGWMILYYLYIWHADVVSPLQHGVAFRGEQFTILAWMLIIL